MSYCLEVVKQDLAQSRVAPLQAIDDYLLADGEAMIKVDRFGLTANNITYGVAGDMIGFWQFFPAELNWGRIPVWGTGTVINAGGTELSEGAVYYGYFPMGSYLVVKPEHVTARGFVDGADHRAPLPQVYNQYQLATPDNGFAEGTLDHRMVFFPLFATGFVLDDYLKDNEYFGADTVILTSASSKTSFSPITSPFNAPSGPMMRSPSEASEPVKVPSMRSNLSKLKSPLIVTLAPMVVSGASSCGNR